MDRDRRNLLLRRLRRTLRVTAQVLAWTVGVVLAVVLLVLLVPAGRRALLDKGLELAGDALPGQLSVARSDWPGLGRLELDGVLWTDGADTLASADTLRVELDLGDLWQRDVTVRQVLAAGIRADVPAIQERLPAAPADTTFEETTEPAGPPPFPRVGAVPPLPSVAIERLAIRRVDVTAAPSRRVWLDSLTVSADLRHDRQPRLAAALSGRPAAGLGVSWRLAGTVDTDSLRLDLAPLHLQEVAVLPPPRDLDLDGHLVVPMALLDSLVAGAAPDWPSLALDDLRLEGQPGAWRVSARLDGRRPGFVSVSSTIPEAPRAAVAGLLGARADSLAPGVLDTLEARWSRHLDPGFDLRVDLEPPPAPAAPLAGRYAVRGSVQLPAPAALEPLLPPQLVASDLGPVIAHLDADYDGRQRPPRFRADLDLGETDWLDVARIVAAGHTTAVQLDSLALRLPGLALTASGMASRDSVSLIVDLDVPDRTLLERWRDPALVDVEPSLDLHLRADGALPLPRVDLAASASLVAPQATIPELRLTATADIDTLQLELDLPAGLRSPQQDLDALTFRFDGAAADSLRSLRGDLRADLRTPRLGLLLAGHLDAHDLATAPAGTLSGDTLRLRVDERSIANPRPWRIAFAAADSSITISDFELRGDLGHLGIEAHAATDSVMARLELGLALVIETLASYLPPEARNYLPAGTLTADGEVQAAGITRRPWAAGRLQVAVGDNDELRDLTAETHFTVGGQGEPPAGIDPGRTAWRAGSARVDFSLRSADTLLTRIAVLAPLPLPGAGRDSVDIRLDAEHMDLGRLQPLLPSGTSLEGYLDADTRIAGLMAPDETDPDLELSGGLKLSDLRASAPDGSWMSMKGAVELDGSAREPIIRGGLDIQSGLIRIPEPPPSLLPVKGDALLWDAAAPAPDSLAGVTAPADTTDGEPPLPAFMPDLTFTINCPGSLWLRGQGLDIELAGDLALHLRDGKPAVEGELEARQGTMKQLGRVFNLKRGRIIFYADEDELNPELDLALGVRVNSYDITIALTGTADDPRLEFSSSPDLTDGDIISVLLFGKTSDELNEGQSGLMADRAAQVALAYGSVALQERLARELGVDVLSIAPSSGDSETSSLTVGKYLNPRVMVRYEQVLSEESAFYVHLDYALTESQEWKLHSQVSQGEASGVEFKWEKDW